MTSYTIECSFVINNLFLNFIGMPKDKKRRSRTPDRKNRHSSRKRSRSRSPDRHREKDRHRNEARERTLSSPDRHREAKPSAETRGDFSFEDYKKELDALFFTERDVIKVR